FLARARRGRDRGGPKALGRRRARPQGHADELSSRGRGRRRAARRDRRRARRGFEARNGAASFAATPAWPAGAKLSASRFAALHRGRKALKKQEEHKVARLARGRLERQGG